MNCSFPMLCLVLAALVDSMAGADCNLTAVSTAIDRGNLAARDYEPWRFRDSRATRLSCKLAAFASARAISRRQRICSFATTRYRHHGAGRRKLPANSHVSENAGALDPRNPYRQHNALFHNESKGRFRDASAEAGLHALPTAAHRGAAFGDLNNDGLRWPSGKIQVLKNLQADRILKVKEE